jgi:hypothetical protein
MPPKAKKTFYLDENKEQPVTSGGVILYRFVKGNMELLLVESRGGFEDLGGRIDDDDDNIYTTVAREAYEESNELLSKITIKKRIKEAQFAYMERSKYVVYIIEANKKEIKLISDDFGDIEEHDNIARKIKWIPVETFLLAEVIKHKLNWRLKNKALFDILKFIKNDKKCNVSMFSETSSKLCSDGDSEEKKPLKIKTSKK